jgi:hypothetical protein
MPPSRPPNIKYRAAPAAQRGSSIVAWLFVAYLAAIVIAAVTSGYFFGSIFIGTAALPLVSLFNRDNSAGQVTAMSAASMVLVGLGLIFIVPWFTDTGPGLSNDDRYRTLLNESAYSCQAEHYDEQNCRAQKRGLDAAAKWYNEQKR